MEELKTALEKTEAKLEKMIDALEDAKANAPDNVPKLQRAVEKNQLRVNQAKQNLEKAVSAPSSPQIQAQETVSPDVQTPEPKEEASQVDLSELKNNIDKAEAKLEKMRDALQDAQENAPDNVEKLQRAVTKNETRVKAAQTAYESALAANGGSNEA